MIGLRDEGFRYLGRKGWKPSETCENDPIRIEISNPEKSAKNPIKFHAADLMRDIRRRNSPLGLIVSSR